MRSKIAAKGWLIIKAIIKEVTKVTDMVMGIDLINSPIMPVASKSGKNAQTVVKVVVVKTILKSFNTNKTASSGVNLPERRYCLVAETTTIASSTNKPKAKINENKDKKLRLMSVINITPKVAKNTNGIANPATKASLNPTIKKRIVKTNNRVKIKS